jgi:hypothetical protein
MSAQLNTPEKSLEDMLKSHKLSNKQELYALLTPVTASQGFQQSTSKIKEN